MSGSGKCRPGDPAGACRTAPTSQGGGPGPERVDEGAHHLRPPLRLLLQPLGHVGRRHVLPMRQSSSDSSEPFSTTHRLGIKLGDGTPSSSGIGDVEIIIAP